MTALAMVLLALATAGWYVAQALKILYPDLTAWGRARVVIHLAVAAGAFMAAWHIGGMHQ